MRGGRRPVRNRYNSVRRNRMKPFPILIVLLLSVGCGYGMAKYVVEPVVNYAPNEEKVVEDAIEIEEKDEKNNEANVTGYALQFGCYSSKAAAEAEMNKLGIDNLKVIEIDNMYKIIGKTYEKKNDAKAELEKLPPDIGAFITTIE